MFGRAIEYQVFGCCPGGFCYKRNTLGRCKKKGAGVAPFLPSKIRVSRSQAQMLSIPSIFQIPGCLQR